MNFLIWLDRVRINFINYPEKLYFYMKSINSRDGISINFLLKFDWVPKDKSQTTSLILFE